MMTEAVSRTNTGERSIDGNAIRSNVSSKWDKVRDAFLCEIRRDTTTGRSCPAQPPSHTASSVEAVDAEESGWGTARDIADLDQQIMTCLEIEGIPAPKSYFTAKLEQFPNASHYYVDLMSKLDPIGIDLFSSFVSHLGGDHPIVVGMSTLVPKDTSETARMIERQPNRHNRQRSQRPDSLVSGGKEYSEDCRSFSWVIRTGDLCIPVEDDRPPPDHVRDVSVAEEHSRKNAPGDACPNLPPTDPPFEVNPESRQPTSYKRHPPKPSVLLSFFSCFCLAPKK